jgi:tetratricopeptide (TPR) repeat protein
MPPATRRHLAPGTDTDLRARLRHLALGTAVLLLACRPEPTATQPPATTTTPPATTTPDACADAPPPREWAAARARVAVLLRCGDAPRALAVYADNLQRDPQPQWAHALATLALAEDAPEVARAALTGLDRESAGRPVGLALLAIAAFEQRGEVRELNQARENFQAALARAPDDPYALGVALRHALAVADREPERLVLAEEMCRRRLAPPRPPATRDPVPEASAPAPPPDPGTAVLASTCARVALLSEEPGEARRRFALALDLDPGDVATRLRWAGVELAASNDGAAADLYQAATDAPAARDRYTAWLGLGVARIRLHDRPGAEAAYRSAAAVRGVNSGDPPTTLPPELQFNLGTLLAGSDDRTTRAEARALLQAYLAQPAADQPRRLRCQQLLLELRD